MNAEEQAALAVKVGVGLEVVGLEAVKHQQQGNVWVPVDAATVVGVLLARGIVLRPRETTPSPLAEAFPCRPRLVK